MEGAAIPTIITFETEFKQGGFVMVQRKTFIPTPNPLMVVVGDKELVIIPEPAIKVHAPVPTVGVFAAIVAPELIQTV